VTYIRTAHAGGGGLIATEPQLRDFEAIPEERRLAKGGGSRDRGYGATQVENLDFSALQEEDAVGLLTLFDDVRTTSRSDGTHL
jgi:hypothetical protein